MKPLMQFAATMDRVNRQLLDLLGVDFTPKMVLIFTRPPGGKSRLDVACEGKGADGRPPQRNIFVDPGSGEKRYWASARPEGAEPLGCHFSLPPGADESDPDNFRCLGAIGGQPSKPLRVDMELRNGERVVELRCKC
ncbi:MAG: hypothetical protein EXR60_02215 [Dehalococcoidia bacterium]|nr:hypothetical protein [Dehalococcoidia bacterium]